MNTAFASVRRSAVAQTRLFSAAAAPAEKSFAQIWLSDKGAYPIIGIISGAVALCTGWGVRFLLTSPDVR